MATKESQIEHDLIKKLSDLKYTYRPDIRDREALEQNFRNKFEALICITRSKLIMKVNFLTKNH
jgi:type I restriction enzyme, R subunit